MTEQYYMQNKYLNSEFVICKNYSLPCTGVVLDFSYVTGYREQTSRRREFLSEVRKQPVFYKKYLQRQYTDIPE